MNKSFKIRNKLISIPIVQGGMGVGISKSNLASSVINCGGIGTISASQIGYLEPEFWNSHKESLQANINALGHEISKVRSLSNGFLAVNILTASRNYADLARAAVDNGADAIVSGAGLPLDLPAYTMGSNTANIPIVSSSRALNLICKRWKKKYDVYPDAVIVEGPKAGGHLGVKYEELDRHEQIDNLDKRFLEVKKYVMENDLNIPIIVAGGIFTKEDAKKYFDLGVDAIQIGTRFIATVECDADIKFKEMFINCKEEDIVYVKSPVGYPGRAIRNNFTEKLKLGNIPVNKCIGCVIPCKGKNVMTPYCITEKLIMAVEGDVENGLVFSGSNGYMVSEMSTVNDVIADLLSEVMEEL